MAEYIDRVEFREHIDKVYPFTKEGQKNAEYDYAKGIFLYELLRTPVADVAPVRHGHWILYKETVETTVFAGGHIYAKGDVVPYGYVCSECGRWESNKEPFCNCGAKMEDES